jgi:hypothetical protein
MKGVRHGLCLLLAVTAGMAALCADDKAPVAPPGYHNVPFETGSGTSYIQVKDTADAFAHVRSDEQSDKYSLNQTSPLSHQSYDMGTAVPLESRTARTDAPQFMTKSYFSGGGDNTAHGTAEQDSKWTRTFDPGPKRADMSKPFITAKADLGDKTAGEANSTSEYAGKTARLGAPGVKVFASSLGEKTYSGREAEAVKRDLVQMNDGMEGLKDLPNRPLTIDEVRALINHGIKPETEEKPAEPSKPLNDPDYTPDAAPAPLRDAPVDDTHLKSVDDDLIPPPGMMAHPEAAPDIDKSPR